MSSSELDTADAPLSAISQASQYAAKAVGALASGVSGTIEAASKLVARRANAVKGRFVDARTGALDSKKLVTAGAAAAVAAGVLVAGIAHVVHHRRACKAYKRERLAKASLAERRKVLEQSLCICPVEDFEEAYAARGDDPEADAKIKLEAGGPGCFAVLAYDADPDGSAFETYDEVYVGGASEMADGLHRHLSGKGNLYVGADVVYGRILYVAFFPCELYQVYSYRERLALDLGAQLSYNRLDDVSEIE